MSAAKKSKNSKKKDSIRRTKFCVLELQAAFASILWKNDKYLWEVVLQYFNMNALHQAFFSDLLLCLLYICLSPNAASLHIQMLSIQWRHLWQSCFGLSYHHMSSAFLMPISLLLSLHSSPALKGNSHYIKASQWRLCWSNPLK